MTQRSWMSSQIQNLTPRVIFKEIRDRDPSVWPSNDDYATYVRAIVLAKMQVREDELTLLQCNDLLKDSRKFVCNIRQKWRVAKGEANFLKYNSKYLDKEVSFKMRGKVNSQGLSQRPSQRKSQGSQKRPSFKVKQRAKKDLGVLSDRTKRAEALQIKQNF